MQHGLDDDERPCFFSSVTDVVVLYFRARLLLVMEYMEGGELFDRISKSKGFTEKKAAMFTKQVNCFIKPGFKFSILVSPHVSPGERQSKD